MIFWSDILRSVPTIAEFEASARQAGRSGMPDWLSWVRNYGEFKRLIRLAATELNQPVRQVMGVAVDHLTATFREARQGSGAGKATATRPEPQQASRPARVSGRQRRELAREKHKRRWE